MFTWQVDAVLDGAREDVTFVPVSIDYEKVVESRSYSRELAGGEKKAEDLKALLSAPKVLAYNYGRIHVSFDAPFSLVGFMKARGLDSSQPLTESQRKGLVRAVANRVMYGISRVSTVTPHALAAAALLGHRRRGVTVREITDRVVLLRRVAEYEGVPLSSSLDGGPSDPTVIGPLQDALRTFGKDGLVTIREAKDEVIYQPVDERRAELSFYKNTLMNLVAGRALVAAAVVSGPAGNRLEEVRGRALLLSRLFKLEFTYRVGATFEAIFAGTVDTLVQVGVLRPMEDRLEVAPEPHATRELEFYADLLRDLLEGYLVAAITLEDVARGVAVDRKAFVKAALETGKVEFLAGRIGCAESLSRTTLENALAWLLEQGYLSEEGKALKLGARAATAEDRAQFVRQLRGFARPA
jgi:glycerol-3-phosphate O-acyltransferase